MFGIYDVIRSHKVKAVKIYHHYEHYYDDNGKLAVTKYTVTMPNGEKGVGLAICSHSEDANGGPNGKRGIVIARGRAFKALKKKRSNASILRLDARLRLAQCSQSYNIFKSQYFGTDNSLKAERGM